MKKTVLLIALAASLAFAGCYASLSSHSYSATGYWHCIDDFCHWHEYGVMEEYYVPYYRYHWYMAPPPPRHYHYHDRHHHRHRPHPHHRHHR